MKKLKLISTEPKIYKDIVVSFKEVKDIAKYAQKLIDKGGYIFDAIKNVPVTARLCKVGEQIATKPKVERDGRVYVIGETENEVKVEGSMVVTNPDGEEYIVKPDKFSTKYRKLDGEKDMYEPIAEPIKVIQIEEDITFLAPWGERIYAPKGSVLNITNINDIYSITNSAFNATYQEANNVDLGL